MCVPWEGGMSQDERRVVALEGAGADVECQYITGAAGTGKTYTIRERIAADPDYGLMTATTGIAAINLGTITLNSALGYYDTDSLEESFNRGLLERKLQMIADEGYRAVIVDEISMMDARQLDLIHEGMRRVNERREWKSGSPLGLILVGDFCQLPPVKAKWAFEADCWPLFERNTERLTKCWRQADGRFLEALNAIRSGFGAKGAELLKGCGVEFAMGVTTEFDGTTIIAKNDGVDRFNFSCHSKLSGKLTRVTNSRWGKLRGEWGQIPHDLQLKLGAYVMLLVNDAPSFSYVNGDCGHISDLAEDEGGGSYTIRLVRNGMDAVIGRITRFNYQRDAPSELGEDTRDLRRQFAYDSEGGDELPKGPAFDIKVRKWIVGGITYYPLRLAYATTVHKSQGLSLDKVQIDLHSSFIGAPAMTYVSLSRARTPEGLRIVGDPELLARRVKVDAKVVRWL